MARLPHFPATPVTPTLTRAVREWSGWFVVAAGAVLCVLGWYGVSGESVIEQQLPYLASATIPGAAMIVAGATLIASRPSHRTDPTDQRIETLYTLLVADASKADPATTTPPPAPPADPEALLAVPGGTLYHHRDCPLVADKPTAEAIDAATIIERSLTPCPVCEPPTPPPGAGRPAPDGPASGPAPLADQLTPDPSTPGRDQPAAGASRAEPDQPAADSGRPGPADPELSAADRPAAGAGRAEPDQPAADSSRPGLDRPAAGASLAEPDQPAADPRRAAATPNHPTP